MPTPLSSTPLSSDDIAKPLSLETIAERIDALRDELAAAIRAFGHHEATGIYAAGVEPIAVPAAEVARMLSIKREQVYKLHHAGILNGFRVHPKSHLKFLVSEVREVAKRMSDERRDA